MIRADIVDPSAYTRPYDHALAAALARLGATVRLITSDFPYGSVPQPEGYELREFFYRRARGAAGSRVRLALKLVQHAPDMLGYRALARDVDVVHFQWLPIQALDRHLLPRSAPKVLTAHDLLPREPRHLWQAKAQQRLYQDVDAIVVHSQYGRAQLVGVPGVDPSKVHVIHHGAFAHLLATPPAPLPQPLTDSDDPVVLFFGLLRQYKGIETLLTAWRGIEQGELWIVGRPRMPLEPLRRLAPARVRFLPRFVNDNELVACFARAEIVVLPYTRTERFDQSGVLAIALAFGKAIVLTDIGGFAEVAATGAAELIKPDDPSALRAKLVELLESPDRRARLAAASRAAAQGPYSWDAAARQTLALYEQLVGRHPTG